jgi:hypothetical protein
LYWALSDFCFTGSIDDSLAADGSRVGDARFTSSSKHREAVEDSGDVTKLTDVGDTEDATEGEEEHDDASLIGDSSCCFAANPGGGTIDLSIRIGLDVVCIFC